MSLRPFVPWPDQRLRTVCAPVEGVDDALRHLWDDMLETMYAMPGVGLAAPQIGVLRRVAVVDGAGDGKAPERMANPEIIEASAEVEAGTEGSPNLPGVTGQIIRPRMVAVRYLDHAGFLVRKELEGIWARSLLHQIDHLNGKMYFDNLSATKRQMLIAKARKKGRQG